MTGYGRAQQLIDGRDITLEVKSVNHRYFEFYSRIPRSYGYLEDKLKSYTQKSISRGKVDVSLTIVNMEGTTTNVKINKDLAKAYIDALRDLAETEGLHDDMSLTSISRFSDIFTIQKLSDDEDKVWEGVQLVAEEALGRFISMREAEGARLKEDIEARLITIENYVTQVEESSPETVNAYRNKLYDKLKELLKDVKVEDQRILTEAAIFAEKTAVDEETVRLKSHINQCRAFLNTGGAVGRKLDFLVQEFNREANTIGSKCQDIHISRIVVEIKAEIEKIREQIQNIE